MNASLVNILSWTNPIKSAVCLILLNIFLLRFLFYQKPICGTAIVLLIFFIRHEWKHRIRPEVLVDPPDCEDWVNLSTYDLEKSTFEFLRAVFHTWVSLRSDHYLMWVVVSSVFWLSLAKFATIVSFPTVLFLLSNGGFVAVPLLKNCNFDFFRGDGGDHSPTGGEVTKIHNDLSEFQPPSRTSPGAQARFSSTEAPSSDIMNVNVANLKPAVQNFLRDEHASLAPDSSAEPESLTPYDATIPSYEDSSEEEFLFDPKHFDSNSSSTSNSFEHLQF